MMQQNHTNGRLTDRERTPARLIVLRVLFTLFAAGTVVFIFSNSLQSGAASGLRSAAVTEWLNGGLARVGVGWRFSERLVRKLGHFSEYALLGFWLMLSLRVYTRRILSHISWPLFFGLLAGVLDEGIQMFADGRGSDVRDVVIDFSNAAAADAVMEYCAKRQIPLVFCTTGLSEEQLQKLEDTAKQTAVLKSANMSLGINLLLKLLKDAAKVLAPAGYDIEIVVKHHNQKLDAPSGTALALADSINEAMDGSYVYTYDRSQVRRKREKKEIGISAVRGGTIVGEHEVLFAGLDEVIELKHTAYSRSVFGKGAVEAARFLAGKPAGMYDMSDVIGLE